LRDLKSSNKNQAITKPGDGARMARSASSFLKIRYET